MLILFNFLRILHRIFPESGFLTYLNYSVDCLDEILFFFFSKSLFKKSLKHPNAGGQIGRAWSWEQRLALVPQLPQQVVLPWTKPSTGKGWADGVSQLSQVLKCIGGIDVE